MRIDPEDDHDDAELEAIEDNYIDDEDCDFDDEGAFGSAGWGTDEYYEHG